MGLALFTLVADLVCVGPSRPRSQLRVATETRPIRNLMLIFQYESQPRDLIRNIVTVLGARTFMLWLRAISYLAKRL